MIDYNYNIMDIPLDIYQHIFDYLSQKELIIVKFINKTFLMQVDKYIKNTKFLIVNYFNINQCVDNCHYISLDNCHYISLCGSGEHYINYILCNNINFNLMKKLIYIWRNGINNTMVYCAKEGYFEEFKYFFQRFDEFNITYDIYLTVLVVLNYACRSNCINIIKYLFNEYELNEKQKLFALQSAFESNRQEIVEFILSINDNKKFIDINKYFIYRIDEYLEIDLKEMKEYLLNRYNLQ